MATKTSTRTFSTSVNLSESTRQHSIDILNARLADTTAGLERAQTERTAYIASLRREQQLTSEQISRLQRRAAAATVKAQEVARQASVASPQQQPAPAAAADSPPPPTTSEPTTPTEPPPAPVESVSGGTSAPPATAPPPLRPGGTMSVYATGYCLKGTTATGLPVGPGIVAVDPSVIPLGTRMTIPGYGEGVAADTGGGIKGARIDVWIKSCAQAALFNRTVTITFH